MKTILVTAFVILSLRVANAIPLVISPGYSISPVATGLVSATGLAIGPTGDIFVTDYRDTGPSRILRVDKATHAVTTYATNLSFATDVAFDTSGRLFVLSGSGSPRDVYQVFSDGSTSLYVSGLSFSVGLEPALDGGLFVGNSGDGTITKISASGVPSTYLAGYGAPNGPFGVALDGSSNLYFVVHGAGGIYESVAGNVATLLATLSPFGPTFLDVDSSGAVFVSDSLNASIFRIDGGSVTTFATGFTGKSSPPMIGPSDIEFDSFGNLYVADANTLWMISPPSAPVPVPATLALLALGLVGLALSGHKRTWYPLRARSASVCMRYSQLLRGDQLSAWHRDE